MLSGLVEKIRVWGLQKGITTKKEGKDVTIQKYAQALKFHEEAGEVAKAVLKHDLAKIEDGIGDSIVTLVMLAEIYGMSIEDCLETAYNEIKGRKGKMVNGSFIKED